MNELTTIGLSETGDAKLDELKELGVFAEKMDGYRFAVSLAVAQGGMAGDITKRKPFLNIGSLDPDQKLKRTVEALFPAQLNDTTVYRLVERLAEWGVTELHAQAKAGSIDFEKLLAQAEGKVD